MTQIREGLATNLSAIPNIQASAYMPIAPTPPTVYVFPARIQYEQAMHGGLVEYTFTVQAFVALGLDQGAQMRLDQMLTISGVSSVKASLESDKTLGGLVSDVWVSEMSTYRLVELPGVDGKVLQADWVVLVNSS